jgi:glycosyltransferase involved in cell wall biosynthesis
MQFSLIITTRGRTIELERVLQSLKAQTRQDFEIIISDQNPDDRLAPLPDDPDWRGRLSRVKSSAGASRGRNAGLDRATGDILCFPDDDCTYPPTLLEKLASFFTGHPEYGFLCGRSVTDKGEDAAARHARSASPVHRESIHGQCIEFAFFIRRSSLGSLRFDENMGVGATTPWHSDEGPDLALRLMENGVAGYYDPQIAVWHPRPVSRYDEKAVDRSYRYACGTGYFLRKHRYSPSHVVWLLAKALAGSVLGGLTGNGGRARFYWARLRGTWRGWRHR